MFAWLVSFCDLSQTAAGYTQEPLPDPVLLLVSLPPPLLEVSEELLVPVPEVSEELLVPVPEEAGGEAGVLAGGAAAAVLAGGGVSALEEAKTFFQSTSL